MTDVRAGQTTSEDFMGAVQASYQNLVYHPVASFMMLFSVYTLLCLGQDLSYTPLTYAVKLLELKSSDNLFISRYLSTFTLSFLKGFSDYQLEIAYCFLLLVPYVVKPSRRNFISVVLLAILVWIKTPDAKNFFVFSQLNFLFTMLRSPAFKFLLLCGMLLVFDTSFASVLVYTLRNINVY